MPKPKEIGPPRPKDWAAAREVNARMTAELLKGKAARGGVSIVETMAKIHAAEKETEEPLLEAEAEEPEAEASEEPEEAGEAGEPEAAAEEESTPEATPEEESEAGEAGEPATAAPTKVDLPEIVKIVEEAGAGASSVAVELGPPQTSAPTVTVGAAGGSPIDVKIHTSDMGVCVDAEAVRVCVNMEGGNLVLGN